MMTEIWFAFVAGCRAVSSLWENPPAGRTPRQRRAGVFHRLRSAFLVGFFSAYCWLIQALGRLGAPGWLVNSVRLLVPDFLMAAACLEYKRLHFPDDGGQS